MFNHDTELHVIGFLSSISFIELHSPWPKLFKDKVWAASYYIEAWRILNQPTENFSQTEAWFVVWDKRVSRSMSCGNLHACDYHWSLGHTYDFSYLHFLLNAGLSKMLWTLLRCRTHLKKVWCTETFPAQSLQLGMLNHRNGLKIKCRVIAVEHLWLILPCQISVPVYYWQNAWVHCREENK